MCKDLTGSQENIVDDVLTDDEAAEATPVCLHCLEPIVPTQYYCTKCGESVGQLTGILPFINIRFQALFIGALWRKAWHDSKASIIVRLFCGTVAFLAAPFIMLVGLPFALSEKLYGNKEKNGENVASPEV